MFVNEIRNAVIDTVEFIIPPFLKLFASIFIAYFVSYSHLTNFVKQILAEEAKTIEIQKIKVIVDNLYLGSVVPIISILILITVAYSVNRITSFIGSLVPISYGRRTTLTSRYQTIDIWQHFPTINSVYELDIKINQLLSQAKSSNIDLPFKQIDWQTEDRQSQFRKINFVNFLIVWTSFCYAFVTKYMGQNISSKRLWLVMLILFVLIIAFHFMVARKELDIESSKLMIVNQFIKTDSSYIADGEKHKVAELKFDTEKKYNSKWWWITLGYRLDWLEMYKFYEFRPPFYNFYQKWKHRKNMRK